MRSTLGVLLVLLIVFIVVSPYFDLPLSTLRAGEALLGIVPIFALLRIAAVLYLDLRLANPHWPGHIDGRRYDRYLPEHTCALLC
jgi:hypothetical protein